MLECPDAKVIHVCLDTLENILRAGDAMMTINGDNKMAQHIEESEGIEMIQQLQHHHEHGKQHPTLAFFELMVR